MTVLFENGIANGASPVNHNSKGAAHITTVTGAFDGASVNLQIKSPDDPNSEWVNVTNALFTAAGSKNVEYIPNGYQARGFISSVGASTDVFMEVRT